VGVLAGLAAGIVVLLAGRGHPPAGLASAKQDPAEPRSAALERILSLHETSLGGARALAEARDFEITGTIHVPAGARRYRALVRREPFGWRQEQVPTAEPDADGTVFVSDGERAWRLRRDGTGESLPSMEAIAILEQAFFLGLGYLDRERAALDAVAGPSDVLPDRPGIPASFDRGAPVVPVFYRSPAGTLWTLSFDARDGRLLGRDHAFSQTGRFSRYGGWKEFGALRVPTLAVDGYLDRSLQPAYLEIENVRSGLSHPPELFGGDPRPKRPPTTEVSRLLVARTPVPGSGYFFVPEVRVNGGGPTPGILDTGAEGVLLEPHFADFCRLLDLGPAGAITASGPGVTHKRWIDVLEFGSERAIQVVGESAPFPGFPEFMSNERPHAILGGETLFGGAPVLDIEGKRLLVRGEPVTPLGRVVEVPFRRERPSRTTTTVEVVVNGKAVPVLLDTGVPWVLRLTAKGIARAGLPTARDEWEKRGGAYPFRFGSHGGQGSTDLLVRLESVSLGPIVYRRPWVLLEGLGSEDAPEAGFFEGLLGAGAFLPFARLGIDPGRRVLEIEPGRECEAAPDGKILVPEPGEYLGFALAPPEMPEPGKSLGPSHQPRVFDLAPGSPAAREGVRDGDLLVAIEGVPCTGVAPAILCGRLWPRPGESVTLLFERPGTGLFRVRLP